jgi:hypothetical protein
VNELHRVKAKVAEVKLSLEALSTVGKPKRQERPLSEAVESWRADPPLTVSRELLETLKPKDPTDGQD